MQSGCTGTPGRGYQTAFMITQTNMFAAAIAGAPVSNMTSAYGGIRWRSGMARQFQYEWSQSRLGATLWEAPQVYIENSPVFFADRIETPLMIQFGDADGAVPWYQGIELYLAMRRLDKDCVFLQYRGEPHHLGKYPNKLDYAMRMRQYFDHYLKGSPLPRGSRWAKPSSAIEIRQRPRRSLEIFGSDSVISTMKRLTAYFIDVSLLIAWGGLLFTIVMAAHGFETPAAPGPLWGQVLSLVCMTLPFLFYFAWTESGARQASLGKRLLGLEVSGDGGTRLSFALATKRAAFKLLPWEMGHLAANQAMSTEPALPPWALWAVMLLALGLPLWYVAEHLIRDSTPYDRWSRTRVTAAAPPE